MHAATPQRPNEIDERRVWYLLLLVGSPISTHGEDSGKHIRIAGRACKPIGVKLRTLFVNRTPRYLFRFLRYGRDDQAAIKLAEAFVYGLSLAHGPMIEESPDSLVLRVPDELVRDRSEVSIDDLVGLEESRAPNDKMIDFPHVTIGSFSGTTKDRHEAAWRIAGTTYRNEHLFEATRFLKRSHDNFYVYPGQIRDVAYDPDMIPRSSSDQTCFEDALQNAFKAIEAVIGDPPRDDKRFFSKLQEIGLDPLEEVGYAAKAPIHLVIRGMNTARDKKAAHGSTGNRTIRAADLLNYQECSRYVVTAALETVMGSSL